MLLLGLCVVALGLGALRLLTERPAMPAGSSYSAQPDGAEGVYLWAEALGATPRRLQQLPGPADMAPSLLVLVQPEALVDDAARQAFDRVPAAGGTLVLAGDSVPAVVYARSLGVTYERLPGPALSASTPDGSLRLALASSYRLRAPGASPLLLTDAGEPVAIRLDYQQGSLVVIGSPGPLSNAELRDEPTARFVYRQLLSPAGPNDVAFDEVHHSFAPAASAEPSLNQLLAETAPGRAVIYAALVTFAFLLLRGRRLGPPVAAPGPAVQRRTMAEHVQMLAGLYRRAGQLNLVRAAFARHYAHRLGRPDAPSGARAALARIEQARSEAELIAAVAAADDAG